MREEDRTKAALRNSCKQEIRGDSRLQAERPSDALELRFRARGKNDPRPQAETLKWRLGAEI